MEGKEKRNIIIKRPKRRKGRGKGVRRRKMMQIRRNNNNWIITIYKTIKMIGSTTFI